MTNGDQVPRRAKCITAVTFLACSVLVLPGVKAQTVLRVDASAAAPSPDGSAFASGLLTRPTRLRG